MPFYHKLGNIPPKRHTQFRKEDGSLYYEQLFGTIGFDGMSTNSYHEHRPTMVKEIRKQYSVAPKIAKANNIQSYRFRGFQVKPENDYLESRKVVLTNADCNISPLNLSTGESSTLENIVLYPNPAISQLNFNGSKENSSYQIFDISGKIIETGLANTSIDVKNLKNGIYFLQIESYEIQKFVKK